MNLPGDADSTIGGSEIGYAFVLLVQDADDADGPVVAYPVEFTSVNSKLELSIPTFGETLNCALAQTFPDSVSTGAKTPKVKLSAGQSAATGNLFDKPSGTFQTYVLSFDVQDATSGVGLEASDNAHARLVIRSPKDLELDTDCLTVQSEFFTIADNGIVRQDDGSYVIGLVAKDELIDEDDKYTDNAEEALKGRNSITLVYDIAADSETEGSYTSPSVEVYVWAERESSINNWSSAAFLTTSASPAITVTPADMTVYEGGKDGYEGVVGSDGQITEEGSGSLPHPLFEITAPKGSNIDPEVLVFTSGEGTNAKTWSVEKADTTSGAGTDGEDSLYYFEPTAEGQDPVRVTYTGADGQPVLSDAFVPTADLYTTYKIDLYPGENNLSEVTASDDVPSSTAYPISVNSGTLTVRAVDAGSPNEVTYPVKDAPAAKLEPGTAAVSAPAGTTYTLNNTDVTVPDDGIALLFDGIIDDDTAERTDALLKKINATSETSEAKYLDLVDTMNGNAWVKASGAVTVYWAYPEGTDKNTDFTLYHFPGLHRDDSTGGSSGFDIEDLNSVKPETVGITKGDNGISFNVASGGFSPFVLTWEKDEPDTPVIPPTTYHTITASAGEGGSISPSGRVTVANHGSRSFSITADEGWTVQNVIVDGVNVGPRGSYTFSDVTEDHTISVTFTEGNAPADPDESGVSEWFDTDDHYAYLHGYGDGTLFGPENPMTRAEAAQMFYNLLRDKSGGDRPVTFEDVPEGAFYAEPVRVLASLGMINGTSPTTYEPDRPITRAEFVAIAMRFSNGEVTGENIFSDVPEDAWYRDYVVGAVGYGWILGFQGEDATFGPEQQITRSQATTVANRMLGRVADGAWIEGHMGELKLFEDVPRGHFAFRDIVEATNAHEYERDGRYEEWTGLTE